MPFPSYMFGTPDDLRQRAADARQLQEEERLKASREFDADPVGAMQGPLGHNAAWAAKSYKWNPAVDALEAFSYQSPASQNQSYADAAQEEATGPLSPWQKYDAVLKARGAQMAGGWQGTPSRISGQNDAGPRPWGEQANDPYRNLSTDELITRGRAGTLGEPPKRASNAAFNALSTYFRR